VQGQIRATPSGPIRFVILRRRGGLAAMSMSARSRSRRDTTRSYDFESCLRVLWNRGDAGCQQHEGLMEALFAFEWRRSLRIDLRASPRSAMTAVCAFETWGDVSCRRQPDIADRGRGRRSWAESVPSRVLKKCFAPGADRERNGIQESPERNQTAAEMSFSRACSHVRRQGL
jgi:hypothetical protein